MLPTDTLAEGGRSDVDVREVVDGVGDLTLPCGAGGTGGAAAGSEVADVLVFACASLGALRAQRDSDGLGILDVFFSGLAVPDKECFPSMLSPTRTDNLILGSAISAAILSMSSESFSSSVSSNSLG
jgi:hypothetical protein